MRIIIITLIFISIIFIPGYDLFRNLIEKTSPILPYVRSLLLYFFWLYPIIWFFGLDILFKMKFKDKIKFKDIKLYIKNNQLDFEN